MKRLLFLGLATLCLLFGRGASAQYVFTNIADSTMAAPVGNFTGFGFGCDLTCSFSSPPAISGNNAAFRGFYIGGHGIFVGSGGPLTKIAKTGDPAPMGATFYELFEPVISGSRVLTTGFFGGNDSGIFSGDGGQLTTIVKAGDAAPLGSFITAGEPAVSGESVVFRGFYVDGNSIVNGVFADSSGAPSTFVQIADAGPGRMFETLGKPAISVDTVSFVASYAVAETGGFEAAIFTANGGSLTRLIKTGDPAPTDVFFGFGDPSISGSSIAFVGGYDATNLQRGIFMIDQTGLKTIAKTGDLAPSGVFTRFASDAVTISGSAVVFHGIYGNQSGIFATGGEGLTSVIKTGDSLFGSTVSALGFNKFGLDPAGSGNLTFNYLLADGRQGVAVAKLIPEPCTWSHALLALLAWIIKWTGGRHENQIVS